MRKHYAMLLVIVAALLTATLATAKPVTHVRTEPNVDWTSAGISGVGGGSGTITVTGVSGIVKKAFLYWHGIDSFGFGGDGVYDNDTVSIDGSPVTGVALGDATTNCWGEGSSRAFRADVTAHVSGDGPYAITGLSAKPGHNANGASLVVIFDDGNVANNRDLVFFEGNDSNVPSGFPGEDSGWNATLTGIQYAGGPVVVQLHLGDGQDADDGDLTFAGPTLSVTILDTAGLYDGISLPTAGTSRHPVGQMWDIHAFDITGAFGASGPTTLIVSGMTTGSDCLGLVLLLVDLDPFTAPPSKLTLAPDAAVNPLGTTHTVTATVDPPEAGHVITFEILSGPNAGETGMNTTDANGQATFTYTGDGGAGTDLIEARFTDSTGSEITSNTAAKLWQNNGPVCNGLPATIYVKAGIVQAPPGHPQALQPYLGWIEGTTGDDVIVGTDGSDLLKGFDGDDTICGLGGDDRIEGGNGNDWIDGGEGNDLIKGQFGNDELLGGGGNDRIEGGPGDDFLDGGTGTNILNGESGTDDCISGPTFLRCE